MENHPYYSYYKQDNLQFKSKIYAFYASTLPSKNAKNDIIWCLPNFENNLIKNNLHEEPIENLQDLYRERAVYLRDTYEYLILNYSGGPDSHNILETFLLNNIFLDEIFIYSYFDEPTINKLFYEDPETFHMFPEFYEAEKSALPVAKYLIEKYSPHTKITFINNFYEIHNNFWEQQTENDFIESIKGNASVMVTHRHMQRSRDPNFKTEWKTIKQKKHTAHIWGIEKPRLTYDNKGVFFALLDHTVLSRIDLQYQLTSEDIPNNHELFYIHPNFTKMYLKQAHIILSNTTENFLKQGSTRAHEDTLAKLLYNFKTKIPYSGLKISDLLNKYQDIPILKEMSKTGIIPGYADMVEPLNMKLYLKYKNSKASLNYDRFISFIHSSLFSEVDKKKLIHTLAIGFPSKKYYIKLF